jgi:hypothetical protein
MALLALGACGGRGSGSSSGSSSGSVSGSSSGSTGGTPDGGAPEGGIAPSGDAGLFASCSLDTGCVADCSAPANDPIAATDRMYNVYDGCILAAMQQAGLTEPWMGQMLKAQAINESNIVTQITTNDSTCGGQNCGVYAISAGASSGDPPGA